MPENKDILIQIEKLSCSYSLEEDKKVLYIDNLQIENGKMVFLLGASGSGKSTLLETIGLMNNTIASGHVYWYNNKETYDFATLWKAASEEKINDIRKSLLSFIFQNTNLMENFTAYENICLSQMIKSNEKQGTIMQHATDLMNQIGLPLSTVNYQTLSVNLSGGQRQRVSFVRALNSNFKVLLCDEPTGNLDEVNANELLQMIRQNVGNEKTAIIVSHDINLALKYADQIVLLTRNNKGYGEVLNEHVFEKQRWDSLSENELTNFRNLLVSKFHHENKVVSTTKPEEPLKQSLSYKQLFLKKETEALVGKKYSNRFFLILILSLTFIAMGFSNGALEYLDKKKNDPFINWLAVMIPYSKSSHSQVEEFTEQLNEKQVKKEFNLNSVTAYKEFNLPFFKYDINDNTVSDEIKYIKGRLLSNEGDGMEDPLTPVLFGEENYIAGDSGFKSKEDVGVVVTQQLLEYLGYPENASVIYFDNNERDTSLKGEHNFKVPVPVRAVVKNLPNRNKFITTEFFFKAYISTDNHFNFTENNRKKILFFIDGDEKFAQKTKDVINEILGKHNLTEIFTPEIFPDDTVLPVQETQTMEYSIDLDKDEYFCKPGYVLRIEFDPIPHYYTTTESVYKKIAEADYFNNNKDKIHRVLDYYDISANEETAFKYDYLSVNFKNIDKVEEFSDYLVKTLNTGSEGEQSNVIEIDTAKIKDKKNFLYIMNITLIITFLLIAFSILSICLFVSNLLRTHLNKVKMNLGTYKAFGLGDKQSTGIYLTIMLRYIVSGILISLVIAFIFGTLINYFFKSRFKLEDLVDYFILFNTTTIVLVLFILIITILVSYFNINKILSKTPGDLIYNR